MEKKLQIPTELLCYGMPDEIIYYLNYCKSLRFEDRPDYDYLRGLFIKLLTNCLSMFSLTKELIKFYWCYVDPNMIWDKFNQKKTNKKKTDDNYGKEGSVNSKNSLTPKTSEKRESVKKINDKLQSKVESKYKFGMSSIEEIKEYNDNTHLKSENSSDTVRKTDSE